MYSLTPIEKLPLFIWFILIFLSALFKTSIRNFSAFSLLKVTLYPIGFLLVIPNVDLLCDKVATGFLSEILANNFWALCIFSLSAAQPIFKVTFSILIFFITFILITY